MLLPLLTRLQRRMEEGWEKHADGWGSGRYSMKDINPTANCAHAHSQAAFPTTHNTHANRRGPIHQLGQPAASVRSVAGLLELITGVVGYRLSTFNMDQHSSRAWADTAELETNQPADTRLRRRTRMACDKCHSSRTRCDGLHPW